jgi:hypothetical protein
MAITQASLEERAALDGTTVGEALAAIIEDNMAGGYFLTEDIDVSDVADWDPIGSEANRFTGTFNGGGHTITGLNLDVYSGENYQGFFAYFDGASVSNLTLENINIDAIIQSPSEYWDNQYTGGLAGYAGTGTDINNVSVTGKVRGDNNYGGIVGWNTGTIRNSHTNVELRAVGDWEGTHYSGSGSFDTYPQYEQNGYNAGGITGTNTGTGHIYDSYAQGDVYGDDRLGVLVGDNSGTIERCYAVGDVEDDRYEDGIAHGGLVGTNSGNISDSYSMGAVFERGDSDQHRSASHGQGGFVGQNSGTITNCFPEGTCLWGQGRVTMWVIQAGL